MQKVAIIIPCYNEEESISKVIDEIRSLPDNSGYQLTPIIINDCSTDKTPEILKSLKCDFIDLPVNLGIGGAVQTGFRYAFNNGYDIAIQLDGDGQHPAREIPNLLTPVIAHGYDIVIGSRFIKKEGFQSTFFRRMGINYFRIINKFFTGVTITDSTSGFRAINRAGLKIACNYYPDEYPEPETVVLFALNNLKITEIPVNMRERMGGVSSIRFFHRVYYMVVVSLSILFTWLKLKFDGKSNSG